jgi:hypothetical protein
VRTWFGYGTNTIYYYRLIDHNDDSSYKSLDTVWLREIEVKPRERVLTKSNVDVVDTVGDDIANTESQSTATESSQDYGINAIFNTAPAAVDVGKNVGLDAYTDLINANTYYISGMQRSNIKRNWDYHNFKFVYLENPNSTTAPGNYIAKGYGSGIGQVEKFVRVHEWCRVRLGSSESSDDIVTFSAFVPIQPAASDDDESPDHVNAKLLQQESGVGYILSQTLFHIYSQPDRLTVKFRCDMKDIVEYTESGIYENPFFFPSSGFLKLSPSLLAPPSDSDFFESYSDEFEIVACTVNNMFEAEVTMISKNYNVS